MFQLYEYFKKSFICRKCLVHYSYTCTCMQKFQLLVCLYVSLLCLSLGLSCSLLYSVDVQLYVGMQGILSYCKLSTSLKSLVLVNSGHLH